MARFINLKVDMDELLRIVAGSARTCLAAHGIGLPDERFKEIGGNVAGSLVLTYSAEEYEERLELYLHIVSAHCNAAPPGSLAEMLDYHHHEHEGPGTIRNHPESSRHFNLRKVAMVLSETDDDEAP